MRLAYQNLFFFQLFDAKHYVAVCCVLARMFIQRNFCKYNMLFVFVKIVIFPSFSLQLQLNLQSITALR